MFRMRIVRNALKLLWPRAALAAAPSSVALGLALAVVVGLAAYVAFLVMTGRTR